MHLISIVSYFLSLMDSDINNYFNNETVNFLLWIFENLLSCCKFVIISLLSLQFSWGCHLLQTCFQALASNVDALSKSIAEEDNVVCKLDMLKECFRILQENKDRFNSLFESFNLAFLCSVYIWLQEDFNMIAFYITNIILRSNEHYEDPTNFYTGIFWFVTDIPKGLTCTRSCSQVENAVR
jgi:hypothetical protein